MKSYEKLNYCAGFSSVLTYAFPILLSELNVMLVFSPDQFHAAVSPSAKMSQVKASAMKNILTYWNQIPACHFNIFLSQPHHLSIY